MSTYVIFDANGLPRHHPEVVDRYCKAGWWHHPSLFAVFAEVAAHGGDRVALVFPGGRRTYRELLDRVEGLAAGLWHLGIRAGDIVSIQLPNYPSYVELLLACARLGCIVNPINPRIRGELRYLLGVTQSPLLVIPDRFRGFDYVAFVSQYRAEWPHLRHIVVDGRPHSSDTLSLDSLYREDRTALKYCPLPPPTEPWLITFTSGTTGDPKGVVITHHNTLFTLDRHIDPYAFYQPYGDDVALTLLPVTHIFALYLCLLGPLLCGLRVVLQPWFDAEAAVRWIEAERVTFTALVPTLIEPLLRAHQADPRDVSSLRLVQPAGEVVTAAKKQALMEGLGCEVREVYGLAECTWPVAHRPDSPVSKRLTTSGSVTPGVELRVVDEAGHEIPDGQSGELVLRSPSLFAGYFRNAQATTRAITPDGWFFTGDIGVRDAEGYVTIAGRKRDMIIRHGLNIFPQEIEDALREHPAIDDVAVVGLPDPDTGERCCACVVPKSGAHLTAEEVVAFLRDKIAVFKLPEQVEFFDALPTSAMGKVLRRVLQERLASPRSTAP